MRYLGGKSKIAKKIAAQIQSRLGSRLFIEPFCGALNITAALNAGGIAADISPALFALYSAMCRGWRPPATLSEADYIALKTIRDPQNPMTAFAGFGCSFGGIYFGTFARGEGRDYSNEASRSLIQKFNHCGGVTFANCSYDRLNPPPASLIYCDPPYANTADCGEGVGFDNEAFYQRCREWAKMGARVLVSEYSAPPDFRCVWEQSFNGGMRTSTERIERLYEVLP